MGSLTKVIAGCWILLFITAIKVSCDVSLTSVPSPLEGSTLCSGAIVMLNCTATNYSDNTVRWFHDASVFAASIISVVSSRSVPLKLTTEYNISGLSVILTSLASSSNGIVDYESLLLVDTLVYDTSEIRSFSCGGFNDLQSNSVALNFTVQDFRSMTELQSLVATYDDTSHQLTTVTATWSQSDASGSEIYCPFDYIFRLTSNSSHISKELMVLDNCINSQCSAELLMEPQEASSPEESFTVSLETTMNGQSIRNSSFPGSIDAILPSAFDYELSLDICKLTVLCSNNITDNTSDCIFQYGESSLYDDLGPPLHVSSDSVSITNFEWSTVYYFQLSSNTTDGSHIIRVRGEILNLRSMTELQSLVATYDDTSHQLTTVTATWSQNDDNHSGSEIYCPLNYTFRLTNNFGHVRKEFIVFENCLSSKCTTDISLESQATLFSKETFIISLETTMNGHSMQNLSYSMSIDAVLPSSFDYSLSSDICKLTVFCSNNIANTSDCIFQYGESSLYDDLGPPVHIPSDFPASITNFERSTVYYFQLFSNTADGSHIIRVRGEFNITLCTAASNAYLLPSLIATGVTLLFFILTFVLVILLTRFCSKGGSTAGIEEVTTRSVALDTVSDISVPVVTW